MNKIFQLLIIMLVFFCMTRVEAFNIVVPNSLASVGGNSSNNFPFNINFSQRYQQVFESSEFTSLSGTELITQIAFRPNESGASAFSSTISNIQINLSTMSATPGTLSTNFASNVGEDDTVVFCGALALSSSNSNGGSTKNFDIIIPLTTPFFYDPTKGNLLLDIRKFSRSSTTKFDAYPAGNSIRVFTTPSGTTIDSIGLVAQFTVEPIEFIPEPTTIAIDIKPKSCPNSLNVKSNGVLPVAILGTAFDVREIDVLSIRLNCVPPIRSAYEDVAAPDENETDPCDCNTLDGEGYEDLVLKFDKQEIITILGVVEDGDIVPLNITGELTDGTRIKGSDCVLIKAKKEK